jgi:hypothetical protein
VSDRNGDREAVVFATGTRDGCALVYLDDGAWVRPHDIVGLGAPDDPHDGGDPGREPAHADHRSRCASEVDVVDGAPDNSAVPPAGISTLGRSLEIARSVLGAFWDNSAYEDYRREDGWTDAEFDRMLVDLDRLGEVSTMPAPVVALIRNEDENGRWVFLGVYTSREKAEAARQADAERYEGVYDTDDYTLLESKVE